MDSLDRLSHSLEAAVALIHSLRRENRELAHSAALAAQKALEASEVDSLRHALDEARIEIERLRQEPAVDVEAQERARQAELESARLAEALEEERRRWQAEKAALDIKVHELELKVLAAAREEMLPIQDRGPEVESLSRRCAELEVMLSEAQSDLERAKGEITAMQVRIAESADPEEVASWTARIHALTSELESLKALQGMKERIEADKLEVKRQKKLLASVFNEREMTRRKIEEIYSVLENLRLN